jgi:hypothetical protein
MNCAVGKDDQIPVVGNVVNDAGVPLATDHLKGDFVAGEILPGTGTVGLFQLKEFLPERDFRKRKQQ